MLEVELFQGVQHRAANLKKLHHLGTCRVSEIVGGSVVRHPANLPGVRSEAGLQYVLGNQHGVCRLESLQVLGFRGGIGVLACV